ncbi:MAG: putative phage abortive infection protein [Bacteroidetes bacterium]|nr:putative phage abortive infection protein [Bacteroidota bacterium]
MSTPEFIVLLFLVVIGLCILKILLLLGKFSGQTEKSGMDNMSRLFIITVFCFVVTSFFSPVIFTSERFKVFFSQDTGFAGDTIGGLMNPFIALAGVIVTGLAFYMQYKANEQQKQLFEQQIRIQKFESQFYEMLHLHRENINEMKINGYDFEEEKFNRVERITEGRKVFVTMKTEFECILSIYKHIHGPLTKEAFNKCYRLFFFGVTKFGHDYPEEEIFLRNLKNAREQHKRPKNIVTNEARKKYLAFRDDEESDKIPVDLAINYKPFSGHASRLGHYFRHLYMIVGFIVYNDIGMDYLEKMKYLKMLRAQLSNHEQVLLFYNWLGEFGTDWENGINRFFTEYRMIHNLWHDTLFEDNYIIDNIKYLIELPCTLRIGELFENNQYHTNR